MLLPVFIMIGLKGTGNKVYTTFINRNVRLGEAPSYGKPIILYDASSTGSNDYMNLSTEILNKNG